MARFCSISVHFAWMLTMRRTVSHLSTETIFMIRNKILVRQKRIGFLELEAFA